MAPHPQLILNPKTLELNNQSENNKKNGVGPGNKDLGPGNKDRQEVEKQDKKFDNAKKCILGLVFHCKFDSDICQLIFFR